MTWGELVELEPFLENLYLSALWNQTKDDEQFFEFWYKIYKPIVSYLVGWNALDPALRSSQVYDITYQVISDALQGVEVEKKKEPVFKPLSIKEIYSQNLEIQKKYVAKKNRIYEEVKEKNSRQGKI